MATNEQQQDTAAQDAVEARREKDRLRKRDERAKEKAVKATMRENFSCEEFWAANCGKIKPEALQAMREREKVVIDVCEDIRGYIGGVFEILDDEDREWLDETITKVQAEIKQFGMVDVDKALFSFYTFDGKPSFNAATYNAISSRGDATAVFAQFGILTALPSRTVRDWDGWVRESRRVRQSIQPVEEMILLRCESPGCSDPGMTVSKSWVDRYRQLKTRYYCHNCLSAEKKVQGAIPRIVIGRETVVDGRGRVPADLTDFHLNQILRRGE
jgi:hypothetical protein